MDISKENFLLKYPQELVSVELDSYWNSSLIYARDIIETLPKFSIFSIKKKIDSFFFISSYLEKKIAFGEIGYEEALLVLDILCFCSKKAKVSIDTFNQLANEDLLSPKKMFQREGGNFAVYYARMQIATFAADTVLNFWDDLDADMTDIADTVDDRVNIGKNIEV